MTSISAPQLTLNFEPALPDRFSTLRKYVAHRVHLHAKSAKTIAADMDMSPSLLSRKLTAGDSPEQLTITPAEQERIALDNGLDYFSALGALDAWKLAKQGVV